MKCLPFFLFLLSHLNLKSQSYKNYDWINIDTILQYHIETDSSNYYCHIYHLDSFYLFQEVFWKDGAKKSQYHTINGDANGEVIEWYKNGQKKSHCNALLGAIVGIYKEWYDNGQIKSLTYYPTTHTYKLPYNTTEIIKTSSEDFSIITSPITHKGRLQNGKFTSYYKNGQIKSVGSYKDGSKDQIWKYWSEDGTLIKSELYKNGYWLKNLNSSENK